VWWLGEHDRRWWARQDGRRGWTRRRDRRGKLHAQAVGLSRVSLQVLGPWSFGIFWSRGESFRSGPKIATHIGPLLELVFGLFLGLGAVFGIATQFSNSAGDAPMEE
jgi:hypothetical protein